jgi:hypothetical protein
MPHSKSKWIQNLIFFVPTLLFWPVSYGIFAIIISLSYKYHIPIIEDVLDWLIGKQLGALFVAIFYSILFGLISLIPFYIILKSVIFPFFLKNVQKTFQINFPI